MTALLDLVIGTGAQPDPAGHLVRVLAGAPAEGAVVIASVTGTDQDPQVRHAQVQTLEAAGVLVAPCNAGMRPRWRWRIWAKAAAREWRCPVIACLCAVHPQLRTCELGPAKVSD